MVVLFSTPQDTSVSGEIASIIVCVVCVLWIWPVPLLRVEHRPDPEVAVIVATEAPACTVSVSSEVQKGTVVDVGVGDLTHCLTATDAR